MDADVSIVVDSATFAISRRTAAFIALRLTETDEGKHGDQGRDGAAAAALAIDNALANNAPSAVINGGAAIDALFYALNLPGLGDTAELAPLYAAGRAVHDRLLGQ